MKRSFRHWTPRYIWNRTNLWAYECANPNSPWLVRSMIDVLSTWLRPQDEGLEFGSGRSTVWFAKRVRFLTSVEHNREWHIKVSNKISKDICNVRLILRENKEEYIGIIDNIKDRSLDFCLIDGIYRDICTKNCLDKIKSGGILIVDNVNRYIPNHHTKQVAPSSRLPKDGYATHVWAEVGEVIQDWRYIWVTDGVTDTALWVKP